MEFSNELVKASAKFFPLRYRRSSFRFKCPRNDFRAKKGYNKPPMGRFVIAQYMGYVWAKKKGVINNDLCKALGYGLALIPNCVKKGWGMSWGESKYGRGHPSGLPKSGEIYAEHIIQNAEDLKKYPIETMGKWAFVIDKEQNRICSAKFHYQGKIEWWSAKNFDNYSQGKISGKQAQKLLDLIKKEWQNLEAKDLNYKYNRDYKFFWQHWMDRFGNQL